jgi:hypothetical protein
MRSPEQGLRIGFIFDWLRALLGARFLCRFLLRSRPSGGYFVEGPVFSLAPAGTIA